MIREALRRGAPPAVVLLIVALVAGGVGYATAESRRLPSEPPQAPPSVEGLRGIVKELSGERLTLTTAGGERSLVLPAGATVEALRPAEPSRIRPGDWLNVGGVTNPATIYTLSGLVLIPSELLVAPSR